ncbi:type IV secretion system protein [Lysobacter enzymogenes]|uniref:type IV secretion system protein n=1 Tax=Lysobacter enzymogenes TaxID=69 RepID=UPI000895D29E|nr:type IV secretion system protein [Lysobacter enzymogenes]SDX19171.1 type IV secretion system protein VirB6 [Lysobacter enzymogenes]
MQLITALSDWLIPQVQGIGDYVYFKLISAYFDHKISQFGLGLMKRTMAWASQIALVLSTLWILLSGYRIVTGQSREPMMGLIVNAARVTFIVALATTMSFGGASLHSFFTKDLDREIHELFTDDSGSSADAIDKNLAYMQIAMSAIDVVQIPDDNVKLQKEKERALLFAGVGTAAPPMVAGAMLLLYKFTLAMFIGLGPIFILCLMFDQTKDLFRKWLLYGIGNLFSMAMLSVVVSMTMELMAKIAVVLWVAKATKIMGTATEGLTTQAMQQGGIGLLMTTVIVTVPPAAAMFFQGTAASFNYNTAFGSASKSQAQNPTDRSDGNSRGFAGSNGEPTRQQHGVPINSQSGNADRIKTHDEVKRGQP